MSRKPFPFQKAMMLMMIFTMYFSGGMIPDYILRNNWLHLGNNRLVLILPALVSTYNLIVMRTGFAAIPDSLEESARIDGASEFQIFFKIGIPLGKTGIIAALLLQFLEYWNVVEQPLIFLDREELWPLTLYQPEISLETAGQSLVAAVITLVPTMILFFLCKDHLEKGIVASAVKE